MCLIAGEIILRLRTHNILYVVSFSLEHDLAQGIAIKLNKQLPEEKAEKYNMCFPIIGFGF